MSNLWINWRFWCWHFQVVQRSDWSFYRRSRQHIVTWSRNAAHARGGFARRGFWLPVAFYQGRRWALAIAAIIGALIWWAL